MSSDILQAFEHQNCQKNLACLLTKDTFATLGNSKCDVLLVLDLKDAFHSLRLSKNSNKYWGILPYFESVSYLYQRISMGLKISPPSWQSYCYVRQWSLYAYLILSSLYEMCLGVLCYISLYTLSLHSTLAHLWVPFLCVLGGIGELALHNVINSNCYYI